MKPFVWTWLALGVFVTPSGSPSQDTSRPAAGKDIVIEHVTVVPMDRPGVLEDHSVVVRGDRIIEVAPSDRVRPGASAQRIDGRGQFLLPGLADMHAHEIEADDLELYTVVGVTQLRVLAANPVALGLRDKQVGGDVLRPTVFVEGLLTDGDPPGWPFARLVTNASGVAAEIALNRKLQLPSIKVYSRLSVPVYDAIVTHARAAGLQVVGHVPFDVGIEHALDSRQRSIEHLTGYAAWLSGNAATDRSFGSYDQFAQADEGRMAEIARRTQAAGTWNCPTLVMVERLGTDDLARVPGVGYMSAWERNGFQLGMRPPRPARDALHRRITEKQRALVRALHKEGARLLIGSDTGYSSVVPGYAVLEELGLFVDAGVPAWDALRAATSGAAEFLGQSDTFGSVAAGRRADLLLVAGNPLDDIANIKRRQGVMLRGVWHGAAKLDARLEERAKQVATPRSMFEGIAPPATEGAREFAARYETVVNGEIAAAEQRLFIDRRPDGTRVARGDYGEAGTAGVLRVASELREGRYTSREEYLGGVLMPLSGIREAQLERARLHVTARSPFGDVVERTFDAPPDALLAGSSLATSVSFHERLARLAVGEQVEWPFVRVTGSLRTIAWRLRATRERDATRTLNDRTVPVKVFTTRAFIDGEEVPGTIVLDPDGHLVERRAGNARTVRVAEPK